MNLTSQQIGSVSVLNLEGRFDAHSAPAVAAWLEQAAASAPAPVVVDLSRVSLMDSSALATLVRGMKRCREQNGDLHLCGLREPVRVIVELTRLDRVFGIYPNEEEAVNAFAD